MLTDYLKPTWIMETAYSITPEILHKLGKKGLITDLDNTLIAWNQADPGQKTIDWVRELQEGGITVMMLSNNNERRVRRVARQLNVDYYASAQKPSRRGIRYLVERSGLDKEDIILAGDLVFTDIVASNRYGIDSILVHPVAEKDTWTTHLNRAFERLIFRWLSNKYPELRWRNLDEESK